MFWANMSIDIADPHMY